MAAADTPSSAAAPAASDPSSGTDARPASAPSVPPPPAPSSPSLDLSSADSTAFTEAPLENSRAAGLWALFLGLLLLMLGNGLNGTLVGLRSNAQGFDVVVTGVIMAGYFAGFLISPSVVIRIIPTVGHIRAFAGLASTASSAVLIHSVTSDPVTWTLMRFVFGFCAAGLYVVIESWLNDSATPEIRGRMLSIYMIVSMTGLVVGQLLVGLGDTDGFALFIMASVLVSMSLVPVTLAATTTPPPVRPVDTTSVRDLWSMVPTGVLGALMSGVVVGAMFGLGAVYAARSGLSIERTGLFVSMPMIGAVLFQYPIGWISDRVPRRAAILVVSIAMAAVGVGLAAVDASSWIALGLMVLLGGTVFPLYSLVLSFTLDWTPTTKLVAASGTMVRVNGLGALVGPIAGSAVMASFEEQSLWWMVAAASSVVVVVTAYRMITHDGVPVARQRRFIIIPGRASELVLRMSPRTRRR